MLRRAMLAAALMIGGFVSPARAIEMFTNFNNGTELGNRPYGIDVMPPVRYHAYPPGRCFRVPSGCDHPGFARLAPEVPSGGDASERTALKPQPRDSRASEIRPQIVEPAANRPVPAFEDQWLRANSFLPPIESN